MAVIGGSILIGLLVAEGSLRVFGYTWPAYSQQDRQLGHSHRVGYSGTQSREGDAKIRFNSRGLRGPEYIVKKPSGVWRIAVIGDSNVEAVQVEEDETMVAHLEQNLGSCTSFDHLQIEAINFGVGGYGTAQELIVLRTQVWEYEPDMVLLVVTTANDIENNSIELEPNDVRPYFVRDGDDLVLDQSFTALLRPGWLEASRLFLDRFRVGQLVLESARSFVRRGADEITVREPEGADQHVIHGLSLNSGMQVFAFPPTPVWENAWWITEHLISQMHQEVFAMSADFLVVGMTAAEQVHPDPNVRIEVAERLGVQTLDYPEQRLARLAEEKGISFLPLLDPFLKHVSETGSYLYGFPNTRLGAGHPNETGHRLAGGLIAERICMDQTS